MSLVAWSERGSRWSRQLAAMGVLLLVVRVTWLMSGEAIAGASASARDSARGKSSERETEPSSAQLAPWPAEPGSQTNDQDMPEAKRPSLRRLVVDFGPERADVYVRGSKVGKVPYVGQVLCVEDELIKVQVLPPTGAPISRELRCPAVASTGE